MRSEHPRTQRAKIRRSDAHNRATHRHPQWHAPLVADLYLMTNPQDPYGRIFPEDLTEGTMKIPAMTINGQHYEPQKLTFKARNIYRTRVGQLLK